MDKLEDMMYFLVDHLELVAIVVLGLFGIAMLTYLIKNSFERPRDVEM